MTKTIARKCGLCPGCNKTVGHMAHALQCEDCQAWQHISCAKISTALYRMLCEDTNDHIVFRCSSCKKDCSPSSTATDPPRAPSTRRARSTGRLSGSPERTTAETLNITNPGQNRQHQRTESLPTNDASNATGRRTYAVAAASTANPTSSSSSDSPWTKVGKSGSSSSASAGTGHDPSTPSVAAAAPRRFTPAPRQHCLLFFGVTESSKTQPYSLPLHYTPRGPSINPFLYRTPIPYPIGYNIYIKVYSQVQRADYFRVYISIGYKGEYIM